MDIRILMEGLAAGDALGVTSEFDSLEGVRTTYLLQKSSGWPFEPVGGGPFGFRAGRPTDDAEMAQGIVRAWIASTENDANAAPSFCGERIAENFVEWLNSNPRDIGHATRSTLKEVRAGRPWSRGGYRFWRSNRHAWSNGSLMRNGVVAGMANEDYDVFRYSLHHGLITHWAPLPAICCAAQNWLIRNGEDWMVGKEGQESLSPDWLERFRKDWKFWLCTDDDSVVKEWRDTTWEDHEEAWSVFESADFNPDSFRPFAPIEHMGFCLTTLQIGVWAMQWAVRDVPYPVELLPEEFPAEPFARTGAEVLSWVAMIGRDSDTYGATAGPMIAAVQDLRRDLVERLWAVGELPAEIAWPVEASYFSGLSHAPPSQWASLWQNLSLQRIFQFSSTEDLDDYLALKDLAEPHGLGAFEAGAPLKAIAHVTSSFAVVAQVSYSWVGPHEMVCSPIPFSTRRIQDATKEWLLESLSAAEKLREESFTECCQCSKVFPPEHRDGEICHRCMEQNGVKF